MAFPKDQVKGPAGFIKPSAKKPFPRKQVINQTVMDPQSILGAPSNKRMKIVNSK